MIKEAVISKVGTLSRFSCFLAISFTELRTDENPFAVWEKEDQMTSRHATLTITKANSEGRKTIMSTRYSSHTRNQQKIHISPMIVAFSAFFFVLPIGWYIVKGLLTNLTQR